jgi:phage FluMu gp28-like protein
MFLRYQRDWISDRADVKVYEKSRRIGVTWTEAFDAVLTASTVGRAGADCSYTGYNKNLALEFIEHCATWAKRLQRLASGIEQDIFNDGEKDIQVFRIRFKSGHKIVALSSRPANLRGIDGVAIIDEAAFHDDLAGLLKAALAFLVWGGRVHVISTHNGDANPFNELVNDVRAGRLPYSLHRTTFDEALAQGLYKAICRETKQDWSEQNELDFRQRIFAQYGSTADEELLCIPSAGGGAYLPSVLIESRMRPEIPVIRWERDYSFLDRDEHVRMRDTEDFCVEKLAPLLKNLAPSLMTCFGEDFGRTDDLTVIWPLQFMPNLTRRTPFVVELRNVPFRQQEQILNYIVDRLPLFQAGALDARGNGQYLAEQARLRYGERIEQVMLSIEWYRDNMPRYKAAFEDGTIELPKDADILRDHRELIMERGVAKVREHHSDAAGKRRHGDSAIAGALAWYASQLDKAEYAYQPAKLPPGRWNEGASGDRDDDDLRPRPRWARRLLGF